jgi:hypothetical protein
MNTRQQLVRKVLGAKMKTLAMNASTVTKMIASARKKERVVPAIAMVQEHALTAINAIRMVPAPLYLEAALNVVMSAWNAAVE